MPPTPSRPDAIDVAAVVVVHDEASELSGCVESLRAHAGAASLAVAVCDTDSRDGVEDVARELGAEFLPGRNRGYGAACNRALALSWVRSARYLLFLNPDVRVHDGTLAALVEAADARPEWGIVGPRQVDENGDLISTMGREPTPADYWRAARTGWSDWHWDPERYGAECRSAWVSGSFLLIRRELLEQVGAFDERFFMYSDEVDLCTRARRAGWEVAYAPTLTIMHPVADRSLDPHAERMIQWSKLIYIRKWFGARGRLSMRLALLALYGRSLLRRARAGEPWRGDWIRLGAVLRMRPERYGARPGS